MNLKGRRFENNELGMEIFVYEIEGKELFIGKDIAKLLEYSDESATISKKVDSRYKNKYYVRTIENIEDCQNGNSKLIEFNNNLTMINEFGLYQLVCSSKKEEAVSFQRWIYEDVLPSLRKNNFYINEKQIDYSQINELEKKVKTLRIAKGILHEIVYDIADATTMSFTEASKKLFGKNAKYLKTKLKEEGFIASDGKVLIKKAEFTKPDNSKEMLRLFTNTNVEKCREVDDIKYSKITNFGYLYLKKHFNKKGVSNFKFNCEEQ